MARKLRCEAAGAMYHVLNRGNYRRDLFANPGAALAFLEALFEAAEKFRWQVHAYVLMRNHFHLAIETLEPTLGEGMHWLQTTTAVRFNRYRDEQGHLFQGRYKAMPIEDAAAMARVVDYIHLNPVRAKVVLPEWLLGYRWSSLQAVLRGRRPPQLCAALWLQQRGGWADDVEGQRQYAAYLVELAKDEAAWERAGVTGLAKGWAIGTTGWKKALAKTYAHASLDRGLGQKERVELRLAKWEQALEIELRRQGRVEAEFATRPRKQSWKVEIALHLRKTTGASIVWLAHRLQLGQPASVRGYLHALKSRPN